MEFFILFFSHLTAHHLSPITTTGGHVTGAGAMEQADTTLFHIKGTSSLNTVAVEVTPEAASLNSDDTFVVVTPAQVSRVVLLLVCVGVL